MRKLYKKFINRLRLLLLNISPSRDTYLIAQNGKVTLRLDGLNIHMTPESARRLASELPAFAAIAERLEPAP